MASITYWHRLEPRPRANDITEPLAARVRDPLWFLTRQWQVGEFHGEDAGSPSYLEMAGKVRRLDAWRSDATPRPLPPIAPPEAIALREPVSGDDVALAVELGQTAEDLVPKARRAAIGGALRDRFPLEPLGDDASPSAKRLHGVCAARAVDGTALYRAARTSLPALPPGLALTGNDAAIAREALSAFVQWVDEVFGVPGETEPAAWNAERLEYSLQFSAGSADVRAQPSRDAALEWYSYDIAPGAAVSGGEAFAQTLLPGRVRFRGMPNKRWWAFEDADVDFGSVRPDLVDLGRLVVVEFMVVQGNDWFQIPLALPVGSVCRLDRLLVHDVFGTITRVDAPPESGAPRDRRWTMFTHAESEGTGVSGLAVVPHASTSTRLAGAAIEEVLVARDEMANVVWGIERVVADGAGAPWLGVDREVAARAVAPGTPGPEVPPDADLIYQLQSRVPVHWRPFMPVSLDAARGEIALVRGAVFAMRPDGQLVPTEPRSRILRATAQLREEEVPRSGVVVARTPFLARGTDGSSHLWFARRRAPGGGESASGLRFDAALPVRREA